MGALLRAYGVTERDRVTVAGRRVDDGRRCDLLVVQEGDGSWSVHAPPLGAGVRLRCDVAVSLAEWILARVPGDEGGTS